MNNRNFLKSQIKARNSKKEEEEEPIIEDDNCLENFFRHLKSLDDESLTLQLVKTLNEPKSYMVRSVVEVLDRKVIFELL